MSDLIFFYLHGFLSSPLSQKAQQTVKYCEQIGFGSLINVPTLGSAPAETIIQLRSILDAHQSEKIMLMGSSLGGYYATHLSEVYNAPAVLINPAVRPFEHWEERIGKYKNYYSDEVHIVTRAYIDELENLYIEELSNPDNILALVQTGDETLDYRLAIEKFGNACCIVREGGNHSYENYVSELPLIFEFLLSRIGYFER